VNHHIFKALGNETRLKIVQTLLVMEHNVSDLTIIAKKDQTTVSRHLANLSNVKIVKQRKVGKKVFYSIFDKQIKKWLTDILISKKEKNNRSSLRNKIENYIMEQP